MQGLADLVAAGIGESLLEKPKNGIHSEDVKLSLVHRGLGLHNIIFSESLTPTLKGMINWEFVGHAPALITIPALIEPTFELAKSESWATAADELREAFWDEIPQWKHSVGSKGSQIFLDLYSFGLYLKADTLSDSKVNLAAKEQY